MYFNSPSSINNIEKLYIHFYKTFIKQYQIAILIFVINFELKTKCTFTNSNAVRIIFNLGKKNFMSRDVQQNFKAEIYKTNQILGSTT